MKKVFILHGFGGKPNNIWVPWLMGELAKRDIYAFSLAMPNPSEPKCDEWVGELADNINKNSKDEIYLVGHSLGATTILRYLESDIAIDKIIRGGVLVAGPCEENGNNKISNFLSKPFDFGRIKSKFKNFTVIHSNTDRNVPFSQGEKIAGGIGAELIMIPDGGHLNTMQWLEMPQVLEAIQNII